MKRYKIVTLEIKEMVLQLETKTKMWIDGHSESEVILKLIANGKLKNKVIYTIKELERGKK